MSTLLGLLWSALMENTICRAGHAWRYYDVAHPSGRYAFRSCRLCKDFEAVTPR